MYEFTNMVLIRIILLIVGANCVVGCSVYLEHVGWLDGPEQSQMYSASTRAKFEGISGEAIYEKSLTNGRMLRVYEYFDGEKCVNTSYHPCDKMSRDRWGGTILSVMTVGIFEPIAYMRAAGERDEGYVQVLVIYDIDDTVLAICPPTNSRPSYYLQPNPLCDSLGKIEYIDTTKK